MPKIVIQNLNNKEIYLNNEDKSLLDIIHSNDIDWMHACGKKGRCTTCKAVVLDGTKNLSSISDAERKYLKLNKLKEGERLSCQCKVIGDIVIKIPEENKFPHMNYSN